MSATELVIYGVLLAVAIVAIFMDGKSAAQESVERAWREE